MELAELLVTKLSSSSVGTLTSQRINPAIGTTGTQVPFVTFTVTNIETSFALDGAASSLEKTTVQFDVWSIKHSQTMQILAALRSTLSNWREGQVKWCVWNTQAIEPSEDSEQYAGTAEFTVWYDRIQRIRVSGIVSGEDFGIPGVEGGAPRLDFSQPDNSQYLVFF
ncbi:: DUF3168 [Gemmata massiliana]|uniref:: DUF3168 n=1 Tax=Gemmata massiliana TaxID=1210884 RepID=A0A6P2D137_9BACT|nr:hypothetical protein [Gemmata massiliana]VTR94075.1 : DUF3168 [Gemmata massiliana]